MGFYELPSVLPLYFHSTFDKYKVFNNVNIVTAFSGNTHNYIFSVPPGAHAQDVPYTFYDENTEGNGSTSGVANSTAAEILQRFITTFTAEGRPGEGFPEYGVEGLVLNINETVIGMVVDLMRNSRCAWWQKGLYL